jgi:hypothetical protein|tara:strand:+ start:472 stop:1164 length:693 start_codon:yes stop_codon:yes gene_type:complete
MKRTFITVLSILITCFVFGQDKIDFDFTKDYDSILKLSKEKTSKLFYNSLLERFQKADSTLTNYELVALQIGYTDNPKYYPYQDIRLEREIWSLNEKKEFELSEKKLDTLLLNNPFNILGNREMSYVQNKLGNKESADLHYKKFDLIVASILSTGDGTSYETSWFTLSPADGQWIIKLAFRQGICSMGSGNDNNGNFHDILEIKFEDSEECKKLYFNIEPATKRMFGKED